MDMDDANESESVARFYSDFEGDFEQTISLLEMNVDEVEIEVQQSFEEVSKHVGGFGESSSSSDNIISMEIISDLIRNIGKHLVDEKLLRKNAQQRYLS